MTAQLETRRLAFDGRQERGVVQENFGESAHPADLRRVKHILTTPWKVTQT